MVNTQGYGVIYQGAAVGDVTGNTFYGNQGRVHVFGGFGGTIQNLTNNVMVGTLPIRLMFTEADGSILASDHNAFVQPYTHEYISMQSAEWVGMNLAEWQAFSGQDMTIALEGAYVDLDQQAVTGTLTLPAFSSQVLVAQ